MQKIKQQQFENPLWGCDLGLTISRFLNTQNQTVMIITPDQLSAEKLYQTLKFFNDGSQIEAQLFPEWETLPYDHFSAHEDIISKRLDILNDLASQKKQVLIASVHVVMNRLSPSDYVSSKNINFQLGDKIDLENFRHGFIENGYRLVSQTFEHGEFAIRGSIIDVFPMGSDLPYRIELFDDEVDTIRSFDPETQTSIEKIEKINLLPALEYPLDEAGCTHFRNKWRKMFSGNPAQCPMYMDVSEGLSSAGLEYFIPLFFEETASLIDYLSNDSIILRYLDIHEKSTNFFQTVSRRHEQLAHDILRPILKPELAFFRTNDIFAKINFHQQIELKQLIQNPFPILLAEHKTKQPLAKLKQFLAEKTQRILFCADSKGRVEVLSQMLKSTEIKTHNVKTWHDFLNCNEKYCITAAIIDDGLIHDDILLISENQILGEHVGRRERTRRRKSNYDVSETDFSIKSLAELKIGDAIVHIEHGVGRYLGLETLAVSNRQDEYLKISYAGDSLLYVPVLDLNLVNRYGGMDPDNAPLHHLGTETWARAKRKAKQQVKDVAAELLHTYAQRALNKGHEFSLDEDSYQLFVSQFPFVETKDQESAIQAVMQDMQSTKTMDRLLCGDVGFGKTEVAMRAAFIAAMAGKQVAILAPTTLLCAQHFQTFSDRLADFPIKVEMISRFVSAAKQKQVLESLSDGKVDVIIGTHKLIGKQIKFKQLGLVIIDEEHRFGVNQKERFKSLRAEVDILTMTATPIPRTLNMSFAELRDLSIIATPPAKRLAIKTFVQKRNNGIIKEAISREILRGGQVYFLHNNVETINNIAKQISDLVPEARVAVGHGQMRERELEQTMLDFAKRKFNILVTTTIIETGIDIPTANTIIIDRADRFGLAQLHQLRGRVGRSHHQAYAYLLIPDPKAITKDAQKRLQAITEHEDLGSGFMLAVHDLEIRGAGELLGDSQSGHIQTIGFTLYMEMLERAVNSLKSGEDFDIEKPLHDDIEIDLGLSAIIPADYLPDIHLRLIFYKRIANAKESEALQKIKVEMIDRFGLLPESCANLFDVQTIKLLAIDIDIEKIRKFKDKIKITLKAKPRINVAKLLQLIREPNSHYSMLGATQIGIALDEKYNIITVIEQFISEVIDG